MGMTTFVLTAFVLTATAGSVAHDLKVLRSSGVRQKVAEAAVRVAGSGDAAALRKLGDLLTTRAFLGRLDDTREPQAAYSNLNQVFLALAANPSATTEALCLRVIAAAPFADDPDRPSFVLPALAAVRPMSAATAAVFETMNGRGLWGFNALFLATNGSERAVALLESIFANRAYRGDERVSVARESIVPNRTQPGIIAMVGRLVEGQVESDVALALAETIFDPEPDRWYGKRRNPPQAPSWKTASPEAQRASTELGRRLLTRKDLSATLRTAIDECKRHDFQRAEGGTDGHDGNRRAAEIHVVEGSRNAADQERRPKSKKRLREQRRHRR
jgi:hypothetical protein